MKEKLKNILNNRKFRYGSVATIITVCVLASVILLNTILSVITENHPLNLDVTKNKFYGMSEQTINYLNTLNKNVEIIVLNNKDSFKSGSGSTDSQYYIQASTLIDQYAQNSDMVAVDYIDLLKNPSISTQYSKDNLETNNVIVRSGDQYKVLKSDDLFTQQMSYQTYSNIVTASKVEQAITSAILNVTSDEKTKVQFIKGYDESDSEALETLLEKNNYDVSDVSILTTDISNDTKLAVIFAPKRDYDKESIDKLNTFMENGKSTGNTIVYIANPEQGLVPNLNSFLSSWGINIGDGTVFETSADKLFSMNSLFYAITEYSDSSYTNGINSSIPVAMPLSKPITINNSDDSIKVSTLLQFSKSSGIYPADADETFTITEDTITGPIPAATVSSKTEGDLTSNVAVIGSGMAFDSSLISRSAVNNSSYFVNMFNTLSDREDTVVIEEKSVEQKELGLTASQSIPLGIFFIIILPIILIAVGLFIWIRRRNK